jgi:hypothetical protein
MAKRATPSKDNGSGCAGIAAIVFIGLIATGQAAAGVGSFALALRAIFKHQDWDAAVLTTTSAALFGSVGFGMFAAILVARPAARLAAISNKLRAEPWLNRKDWESARIPASGGASLAAPVMAVVALWWNFATLPLLSQLPNFLKGIGTPWGWLVLVLPMIGALLVGMFVHQFLRAHRFGRPIFEMASVPGIVGGQLAGVVRIPRRVNAPGGFRLRLLCVEWVQRQEHKRVDHVIWQDERLVKNLLIEENDTAIPVLFAIPFELPETSRPDTDRDFEWRLEVWANLPGIDYDAMFEVPVFQTSESRKDFQLDEELLAEFAPPPDNELVFHDAGIVRKPFVDGVRLTFRAARNWRSALAFSLIALAFAGMGFVMMRYNQEARDFFNVIDLWGNVADKFGIVRAVQALFQTIVAVVCGAVYVLITLVMFIASLDLWLYRSVVDASPAGLTFRGGLLGVGRTRFFPADDIKRFKLEDYMRSSGGGIWKSVVLMPHRGRGEKVTIAKGIRSKLAQDAVINDLNAALRRDATRRKFDTA